MASYREGKPRTSVAWDHFKITDHERSQATCNHCHASFSFRSSVTNLMKHLKHKHGYERDDDTTSEEEETKEKKPSSPLWQYYEIKDTELKLAICNLCLEQFSYSTGEEPLVDHLRMKHEIEDLMTKNDDDEEGSDDEKMEESVNGVSTDRRRCRSSAAWQFFEIRDPRQKVARCTICSAQCSYRSSVSNLVKHVRRKHGLEPSGDHEAHNGTQNETHNDEEARDSDGQMDTETLNASISKLNRAQRSIVWLYFKCVDKDGKYSECRICKKVLSHATTITNLRKHLARKHPDVNIPEREDGDKQKVLSHATTLSNLRKHQARKHPDVNIPEREDGRKRILLSSGGELYEVETRCDDDDDDNLDDQNGTIEMDSVYVDDFNAAIEQPKRKKRRISKKHKTADSSSEEEITFFNKYKKKPSDELDHFGKYIISLLRKLPQNVSNRLQSDFVKQIMDAKGGVTVTEDFSNVPIILSAVEPVDKLI